jgi:hypothetical protein
VRDDVLVAPDDGVTRGGEDRVRDERKPGDADLAQARRMPANRERPRLGPERRQREREAYPPVPPDA